MKYFLYVWTSASSFQLGCKSRWEPDPYWLIRDNNISLETIAFCFYYLLHNVLESGLEVGNCHCYVLSTSSFLWTNSRKIHKNVSKLMRFLNFQIVILDSKSLHLSSCIDEITTKEQLVLTDSAHHVCCGWPRTLTKTLKCIWKKTDVKLAVHAGNISPWLCVKSLFCIPTGDITHSCHSVFIKQAIQMIKILTK